MAVDTKAPERIEWEYTGHYGHNDPLGTAGANCPACQADRRNHERFAVLQKRYEEAIEVLEQIEAHPNACFNVAKVKHDAPTIAQIARALLQRHKEDGDGLE